MFMLCLLLTCFVRFCVLVMCVIVCDVSDLGVLVVVVLCDFV